MKRLQRILLATLFFISLPVLAQNYTKVTYIHSDADGTPFAATDERGNLEWKKDHYPYGDEYRNSEIGRHGDVGFAGKAYDDEIGLSYFGARWYDPASGRFTGVDPMPVNPDDYRTFNRYAYGFNNPHKYVDPDGNLPILVPLVVFIAKEVAAEGASRATDGLSDFLSVRKLGAAAIGAGARALRRDAAAKSTTSKSTLHTRGARPEAGERTIQGQVDAATTSGNPTIVRNGQDLSRLRSSGHGQTGATATPQNVFRTNPNTGQRFGPQAGPDRAVTNRDIRELYKGQTGQGTSSVRTRGGG